MRLSLIIKLPLFRHLKAQAFCLCKMDGLAAVDKMQGTVVPTTYKRTVT